MALASLFALLKDRLGRLRRPTTGAEIPPAADATPPGEAATDPAGPTDAARSSPTRVIPIVIVAALGLLAAGGGATAYVMTRQHAQALRELETKSRALQQENQRLRAQSISLVPAAPSNPQPAPASADIRTASADSAAAGAAPGAPGSEAAVRTVAAPRAAVSGECRLGTQDDIAATLRPCIERFNRAATRR